MNKLNYVLLINLLALFLLDTLKSEVKHFLLDLDSAESLRPKRLMKFLLNIPQKSEETKQKSSFQLFPHSSFLGVEN